MNSSNKKDKISFIKFELNIPNKNDLKGIIFGKYQIIKTIGKSSYSSVFLGKCISGKKYVAIKVQPRNATISQLEKEAYYQYLLKGLGIPKVISFGHSGKYNVLVETLLGKSIDKLFTMNQNPLKKMKDLCMAAIQIIDRIQYIHSKNIIHQDIKPQNFLVGNPDTSIIYIIDFGLSKKFRSSRTGKHINFAKNKLFRGTFDFSSINSMKGIEMTRRDDLESIGYMLIFLIKGKLPWFKYNNEDLIERFDNILHMKNKISNSELCEFLPFEFCEYMDYVKSLKYEEEPNYIYLRKLFISILDKMNEKYDLKFSWIKNKNIINNNKSKNFSLMSSLNNARRKKSPFYNLLHNSKEKTGLFKAFNTENDLIRSINDKKENYFEKRNISSEKGLNITNKLNIFKKIKNIY